MRLIWTRSPDILGARLLWVMAVLVAAYVVGLIIDGDGFSPLVDGESQSFQSNYPPQCH